MIVYSCVFYLEYFYIFLWHFWDYEICHWNFFELEFESSRSKLGSRTPSQNAQNYAQNHPLQGEKPCWGIPLNHHGFNTEIIWKIYIYICSNLDDLGYPYFRTLVSSLYTLNWWTIQWWERRAEQGVSKKSEVREPVLRIEFSTW